MCAVLTCLEGIISLNCLRQFGGELLFVGVFVGAIGRHEPWLGLWVSVRGDLAFYGLGLGSGLHIRLGFWFNDWLGACVDDISVCVGLRVMEIG